MNHQSDESRNIKPPLTMEDLEAFTGYSLSPTKDNAIEVGIPQTEQGGEKNLR